MSVDFAAGAGPSDCDVFVWIKTTDTQHVALYGDGGASTYAFAAHGAATVTTIKSGWVGGNVSVDGALVTTRGELQAASSDGEWRLMKLSGANLYTWGDLRMPAVVFGSGWNLNGQIGGMVVWDNTASGPLSANQINMMDRYVKGLVS
jgi:hypothetical protein